MNAPRFVLLFSALIIVTASCGGGDPAVDLTGAMVDTLVDPDFLNAGETFEVDCVVTSPSGKVLNTATGFTVEPGKGVAVSDARVTPKYPGIYTVTCMLPDQTVKDDTPAMVTVTEKGINKVQTYLDPSEVTAGGQATVTCAVYNAGSEAVEWPTDVMVTPEEGVSVDGHTLTGDLMGEYEVACRAVGLPFIDETPEILTVLAGDPIAVRATIKEDQIQAGDTVPVMCSVEDAGGNSLTYPSAPDPQDCLEFQGNQLTGLVAGEYDVTCTAPELPELEQIPDHLVVVAGEVAGVLLIPSPNKPVFKLDDTVTLTLEATDALGNVIEGIGGTITGPGDDGVVDEGDDAFTFVDEGAYDFTGTLDPPYENISDSITLLCDETGPEILIEFPPRGATLDGEAGILVIGRVNDAVSDIKAVKVNDENVELEPDGFFTFPMESYHGMNIIEVQAFDAHNNKGKVVQSYYYSTEWIDYEPQEMAAVQIEQALVIFLGQGFLDDGDHDPANIDDLATIVEILLGNLDIASLLGGSDVPIVDTTLPGILNWGTNIAGFEFELNGDLVIQASIVEIIMNNPTVAIASREGGIAMYLGFEGDPDNPGVGLSLALTLGFDLTVTTSLGGQDLFSAGIGPSVATQMGAYLDVLSVDTDIDIHKEPGGELEIGVANLSIDLVGINIEPLQDLMINLGAVEFNGQELFQLPQIPLSNLVSGINDILSDVLIDPILNFLLPMALDLLEPLIETTVTQVLQQVLQNFALDLPIPIPALPGQSEPITLDFSTFLSTAKFTPAGGELGLGAGFLTEKNIEREVLGNILRAGCLVGDYGSPSFDAAEKFQVGAKLDMVNELLFALYWGGGLQLVIDGSVLGNIDLGGFGISDLNLATDFWLPPILDDCNAKSQVALEVGDLFLDVSFNIMGAPLKLGLFVSVTAEAEIFGQGQEIGLNILGITRIGTQVLSVEGSLGPFEGMFDIEELIENILVPLILEQVSNLSLGSFPIPEIDLGGLLPGIPPGSTLTLGNLDISMKKGFLTFSGELL
ncbi:MAG: hypothetical protein ABIK09_15315 [Pseudomonadota bacterium]